MKLLVSLTSITAIAITGMLTVNAAQSGQTIETCAQLLPAGHSFNFSIAGKIDTTTSGNQFNGEFSLDNGDNQDDQAMEQAIQPFLNCVMPLIK